jgi:hypothetical protein
MTIQLILIEHISTWTNLKKKKVLIFSLKTNKQKKNNSLNKLLWGQATH